MLTTYYNNGYTISSTNQLVYNHLQYSKALIGNKSGLINSLRNYYEQ